MNLRETLEKHRGLASIIILIIVVGAILFSLHSASSNHTVIIQKKAYFSSDDGKTFFVDEATKPSPFTLPSGGEAFRANVFSCSDGKNLFVGYLERDDGGGTAAAPAAPAPPGSGSAPHSPPPAANAPPGGSLPPGPLGSKRIKRPGETTWTSITTMEGLKIIGVTCPSGGQAARVTPDTR